MPTYDFRCPNGHTFDVFQKMSDSPTRPCPECGETAERLISGGAGFKIKGGGGSASARSSRTLDGGSSSGEPPHAPADLSKRT